MTDRLPCPHCGELLSAGEVMERVDLTQLKADIRVAMFDSICKWLDLHGYPAAARHLFDVRLQFYLPESYDSTGVE